jgi:membrane protease YdiL (CAAX protease family)
MMLNIDGNQINNFLLNIPSLVKITLFLIIWAAIWLPIAFPLARLVKWHPAAPISQTQKLTLIIPLYLIAPLLAWGATHLGEQSLNQTKFIFELSFFKFILFGYCLGIVSIAIVDGIEVFSGLLHFSFPPNFATAWGKTLPLLLLVSLLIASVEELVFRGIFVNFLQQDYSLWLTAIISSLIFALLHLIWEQKGTIPQLPGLFLMGMVLYLARLVAGGNLGIAIGIHGGWVLVLASLDTFDCYDYNDQVQGWLVGKKGQPLGSLAGVAVVLLTGILLLTIDGYWIG